MGLALADTPDEDEFGDVDDQDFLTAEKSSKKRLSDDPAPPEPKRIKHDDQDPSFAIPKTILSKYWNFADFRLKQANAISRLLSGNSAVVVFPTGGGKSLVYQIPALSFDEYDIQCGRPAGKGVTLVVSPLIALMKDQVDMLRKRGISAAAMDSSQSRESWLDASEKLRNGTLKLLYVAPERLNNEGFIQMISHTRIRLVAIDEAHCISEWGHAFRPDYLKIARFTHEIQAERTLCLTATATPNVTNDICAAFDVDKNGVFRTPTYRPNLQLMIQSFSSREEKDSALIKFLRQNHGSSIIYVQTHEQTEDVGMKLRRAGLKVLEYHAGMSTEKRTSTQETFMASKDQIVVATIAFGMGIDKADIRNIVHFAIPKSIEGYSQEIGRAGRDGLPSTCIAYLCHDDIRIMEEWSRADIPSFRSINGLVGEILEMYKFSKTGDVIERHLNDESREWDIRLAALGLLNAQLELRFSLIRAITPKYSNYKYTRSSGFEAKTADSSKVTSTLKKTSKTTKKWTQIDVDVAAFTGGFPREDAVRKLQQWHDSGAIELSPSGVVNRFRIVNPFPKTQAEKDDIIEGIYEQIKARERSDMERVQQVIDLLTASECISTKLARHFGDDILVESGKCEHCNWCITGKAVEYSRGQMVTKDAINEDKIKAILKATSVRDDANFLARVAFGISSPRVTIEKLGKHEVFGSLSGCDFEALVRRFDKVCKA